MLSPHEFAALLLAKQSPCQIDRDHPGLALLLERDLVRLEAPLSGQPQVCITANGRIMLDAIAWGRQSIHEKKS